MIRIHVSRIGTLSGMELPVDLLRELAADAFDLGQVLDARAHHALESSEARQQLLAPLRAHAGDALERGRGAGLGAPRAVPGDREAVRLVADVLDQVETGMIGRQPERTLADPQLLQPGLALRTLGDADEGDVGKPDLGERRPRRPDLPLAPVDEDRVGRDALPARDASVAARERLVERAVVVARREALDVVAAVFAPAHVHPIVHHARRDRRLAHRVADVEALDALRAVGQPQRFAERREPGPLRALLREPSLERLPRVFARHLEPGAPVPGRARDDAHRLLRVVAQAGLELDGVELLARDDERRYRPLQVMLRDERGDDLPGFALFRVLPRKTAVGELQPAADHHQVDARDAFLADRGDDVHVDVVAGICVLALAHFRERLDLVAVDRGLFVSLVVRRALHSVLQALQRRVAAPLEVELRALHVLGVGGRRDQTDAGRGAAP